MMSPMCLTRRRARPRVGRGHVTILGASVLHTTVITGLLEIQGEISTLIDFPCNLHLMVLDYLFSYICLLVTRTLLKQYQIYLVI